MWGCVNSAIDRRAWREGLATWWGLALATPVPLCDRSVLLSGCVSFWWLNHLHCTCTNVHVSSKYIEMCGKLSQDIQWSYAVAIDRNTFFMCNVYAYIFVVSMHTCQPCIMMPAYGRYMYIDVTCMFPVEFTFNSPCFEKPSCHGLYCHRWSTAINGTPRLSVACVSTNKESPSL